MYRNLYHHAVLLSAAILVIAADGQSASAGSLNDALQTVTEQVKTYLDEKGENAISIGTFSGPKTGTGRAIETDLSEALTKAGIEVVDELDAGLDADRIGEPVLGDLRHVRREVWRELIRPGEVFVAVQGVVNVDRDDVAIDRRRLERVDVRRHAVLGMPIDRESRGRILAAAASTDAKHRSDHQPCPYPALRHLSLRKLAPAPGR